MPAGRAADYTDVRTIDTKLFRILSQPPHGIFAVVQIPGPPFPFARFVVDADRKITSLGQSGSRDEFPFTTFVTIDPAAPVDDYDRRKRLARFVFFRTI